MASIPYHFSRDDQKDLIITKTPDAGEETKFILISQGGMGRSSVIMKPVCEMPAEHWESLEYFDSRDADYYRLDFSTVQEAADTGAMVQAPEALLVRHNQWPGISIREARIEAQLRQKRRLERKIQQARDLVIYREEQARIKAQDEEIKRTAESELASDDDLLAQMMETEFGPDWHNFLP